jgi:hypothetical protein
LSGLKWFGTVTIVNDLGDESLIEGHVGQVDFELFKVNPIKKVMRIKSMPSLCVFMKRHEPSEALKSKTNKFKTNASFKARYIRVDCRFLLVRDSFVIDTNQFELTDSAQCDSIERLSLDHRPSFCQRARECERERERERERCVTVQPANVSSSSETR